MNLMLSESELEGLLIEFTNTQNHNNGTADQLNFVVNALVSQNQNTAF